MAINIEDRIAAKRTALAKAKASLSESDLLEIEQRAKLAQIDEEIAEEERKARDLDLARRLDAARISLGDNAGIRAVAIEGFPDTFLVTRNSKAHGQWLDNLTKASAKNESRNKANRIYACAVVYDWNGQIGGDGDSEFTAKLNRYLEENPGIVTPINNAAAELAGVFATERKS